jgi:UDP-GlcNAc:undecaprenyl-phosphate/decaprenyl-phosphate GlcNAc-1-phosphate transferase
VIASLVGLAVGAGVALALWVAAQDLFAVDALARTNYRDAAIVTGVGVLVPVTVGLVAAAAHLVLLATSSVPVWDQLMVASLVAAAGFGLLGLVDDVAGVGQSGGFRGHVRALAEGRLTSGMLKLVGGAALGVVVGSFLADGQYTVLGALRDGAVVALAANLANLLDRAPGRAVKATTAAFVVAALVARSPTLLAPGVGVGAGLGLLPADLGERCMLGDAGANPLGALCGLAALAAVPGGTGRWLLVAVLVGLNLLSEVVSFSSIIDRTPPLRWLDRAGSLRRAG